MMLANLKVIEKFDNINRDKIAQQLLEKKIVIVEKLTPKFIKQKTGQEIIRMLESLKNQLSI
jgi:hypothetical protein